MFSVSADARGAVWEDAADATQAAVPPARTIATAVVSGYAREAAATAVKAVAGTRVRTVAELCAEAEPNSSSS
jgi:hypothetical protein